MKRISIVFVVALVASLTALAQEKHAPPAKPAALTNPQFEMLKKLAGEWKGKAQHSGEESFDATVIYKVISAGSVVMETLMPGSDHEMVTMYHMDGNDLVLTHYCALGNQPHMKAQPGKDAKAISFQFTGGGNMKSANDMHMHAVEFKFVDDDHITATWSLYNEGKSIGDSAFDLKRSKS